MLVHTSDFLGSKCFSLSLLLAYIPQQSHRFFWIHASSSFPTWAYPLLAIHHQHLFAYFDEVTIGLIILSPLTAMHCLHFVSFLVHPPAFSAWVHPLLAIHHQYILNPLTNIWLAFLSSCLLPLCSVLSSLFVLPHICCLWLDKFGKLLPKIAKVPSPNQKMLKFKFISHLILKCNK